MTFIHTLLTHRTIRFTLNCLSGILLLTILLYYGMGGWTDALFIFTHMTVWQWALFLSITALLLYGSNFAIDIPLFLAGYALGYWGEWWGTTRGVWTYWNNAQPPDYLPPLWGIGVITVLRLACLLLPRLRREEAPGKETLPAWERAGMLSSFFVLPILTFANSLPALQGVDWRGRLDFHFYAGILVALLLILPGFDLQETFTLYLCGMLLGGLYEYLGTSVREWTYITGEIPPLWIAPLWGLAAAAMVKLARLARKIIVSIFNRSRQEYAPLMEKL